MAHLLLFAILSFIQVQAAEGYVYRIFVSTRYYGTNDKVSIILVGEGGAQTKAHDLPGPFDRNSIMQFTITDRDVGKLSAIKIRLVQTGDYQDSWWLSQIFVITSRQRYQFSFDKEVKYQWNTISLNCRKGFKKTSNGKCIDIDECSLESGGCADKVATCHNNFGSYTCTCPLGYRTNYKNRCEDVDECRSNNGDCDEDCINTDGSFHCACRRSGFRVVDGYRCADIDECQEGKDDCDKTTATCSNYPGHFQCKCKPGYEWKDHSSCKRKTCFHFSADRDSHSQLHPARCTQKGQNEYEDTCKVVCNHGYVLRQPAAEIANCSKDGLWVPGLTYCIGRPCPSLKDIPNGSVQAGCKIYLDASTRYGGRCNYWCNSGYDLKGVSYRNCQADGTWSGTEPICEKSHPTPYITCPDDIRVVLKPGMSTADVSDQWKLPTANVKNITAVEPPGVSSSYRFPYGTTIVKWAAVNDIGQAHFCSFHVVVKDNEKPKVVSCPGKIYKVSYSSSKVWVNISRPIFTDNVGIVRYIPPLIDGKSLSVVDGYHMTFTATDASGNSASCKIIVYVGGERCQLPPESDPLSGSFTCKWIGWSTRYCSKLCPKGDKPFGGISWWTCGKSDGKWKSYPPSSPVPQCVGYKEVNTSLPCDVGSIRNSSFGPGCYECPPGTYEKSGACEACAEGTFQDKTGQTDCKACSSGTRSEKGAYQCRPICPPGRYSKDGLGPFCDFCSNGTYQDKPQQTSCLPCPQGTYTLHIGATFCGRSPQITKLEPGDVALVSAGGTVALKCFSDGEPAPSVYWEYSANGKGSKTQVPIKDKDGNPIGTQLTITNADSSDSGSYSCMSANTHGEVTRAVQLTVTKSSFRRETTRRNEMVNTGLFPRAVDQCPTGTFSSNGLGPLCRVCPKSTYQDQPGETACKNCEHGAKTLQLAATSAEACGVSPLITSVNSSVNTSSREAVLDCYAHASPTLLIGWNFLEDVPSDFLGIPKLVQLVSSKGEPIGTRMVIRKVTKHNTGRYECTAVNQFGQDKEILELKVQLW